VGSGKSLLLRGSQGRHRCSLVYIYAGGFTGLPFAPIAGGLPGVS
jgi:hypothetical protein